jgi:hypothetical protein
MPPFIPQKAQGFARAAIAKAPGVLKEGKNVASDAATAAIARARPLLAEKGGKVWTAAIGNAKIALNSTPQLYTTGLQASKNASEIVRPILDAARAFFAHLLQLTTPNGSVILSKLAFLPAFLLDKIAQHPYIAGLVGIYGLGTLIFGPLWPVGMLLKCVGFGGRGVILGESSTFEDRGR